MPKKGNRGGKRENAGRKPIWKNKDTITIRVPKVIATQVLELAHRLDSMEEIELDTESKTPDNDSVIQSSIVANEIITKSIKSSQDQKYEPEDDFVTNSDVAKTEIITESTPDFESITTSNFLDDEKNTKSKTPGYEAVEIAKKILKHKKSARISLAKLISRLYSLTVSPEDLK
jgi:hypothetical protein